MKILLIYFTNYSNSFVLEKFSKYNLSEKEQILYFFFFADSLLHKKSLSIYIVLTYLIYPIYFTFILSYELFVYKNVQRRIKFFEKNNLTL